MSLYARLSCDALTDAKILEAGPDGWWGFTRGILYSKQQMSDGVIPSSAIPLVFYGRSRPVLLAKRLVSLGLWEEIEGGYRIPFEKWAKHQVTREEVEIEREQARIRKQKQREKERESQRDMGRDIERDEHRSHGTIDRDRDRDRDSSSFNQEEQQTPNGVCKAQSEVLEVLIPEVVEEPKPKRGALPDVEIPDQLRSTSGFMDAWSEWLAHLRAKRNNPTALAMTKQLAMLAEQPDPVAVIAQSIRNNYRGLFPLKNQNGRADKPLTGAAAIYAMLAEEEAK